MILSIAIARLITMSCEQIVKLIDRFLSKADVSISLAKEIEAAIDDKFPHDKYMQDTIEMLASYRPGGGRLLYNEDTLAGRFECVKNRLWSAV